MKISYYALGCKVNEYEAAAVVNRFIEHGFELVDFHAKSDVYIINTCTVTATADAKSRKIIRQAVRRNPDAVIAVMGCYSQLNPDMAMSIPGVDIVIGTDNRHQLFEYVTAALEGKKPYYQVEAIKNTREYEELKIKKYKNRTRGFVKIEDGCNNFCSYCTIPYARGRVRSRQPEAVIAEINNLCNQGIKEIVLTGINTAAYGTDLIDFSFTDLLNDIFLKVDNLCRIRISSVEITEITDRLLETLYHNKTRFCNHFHIPLQAGTDKILNMMNRKYTTADYGRRLNQIRRLFPGVNITSDVMVGFPGENRGDFERARRFIESLAFGEMHVFPFSPRPGTKAMRLGGKIPAAEKKRRVTELLALNKEQAVKYRRTFLNKTLQVLVEKNVSGIASGHSSNYIAMEFANEKAAPNRIYPVRMTAAAYPVSQGVIDV